MYCIILDKELTEENIIKELGFFVMDRYKDFHFVHQRRLNLINRQHGTQVIYMELRIAWSSGKLDYDELFAVF